MDDKETHNALERAIDQHVKQTSKNEDGIFVTGWVLVASVSSPDYDETASDGYVTYTSQGLQHHSAIGLLDVSAQERRTISMMSTISLFMQNFQDNMENGEDNDGE